MNSLNKYSGLLEILDTLTDDDIDEVIEYLEKRQEKLKHYCPHCNSYMTHTEQFMNKCVSCKKSII